MEKYSEEKIFKHKVHKRMLDKGNVLMEDEINDWIGEKSVENILHQGLAA
ncbi:MAG: hypothetical protein LBH07_05475 [Treponema sp.]|jgi:hypothetical protein|nr:hypothetical protein [Treponema sp.]